MPQSLTQNQVTQLRACLELAQDARQHERAQLEFSQLLESVESEPATTELLRLLWTELLAARRSSMFWQEISDVEKEMGERLAQTHVQLQQNYLRLMQEM